MIIMELRSTILWICLIAFVGSASFIANALVPNNPTVVIGAAILTGSLTLYIAIVAELMTSNIVSAVQGKNMEEQASVLTSVIGKTLYKVIAEEQAKDTKKV
jgi:hypothetical protein